MESQTVITELNKLKTGAPCSDVDHRDKAIEAAKTAVRTQIPQKPVDVGKLKHPVTIGKGTFGKGTHIIYKCPVCDDWVNSVRKWNYCPTCGQALDWDSIRG